MMRRNLKAAVILTAVILCSLSACSPAENEEFLLGDSSSENAAETRSDSWPLKYLKLDDGRTVPCLVIGGGSTRMMSCDWDHAEQKENQP